MEKIPRKTIDPLVSILIPAYNTERYIKQALDSALMQDYANFEVIVIDDGSKDKTWDIIQSYHDSRLRSFRQENQGITLTRNRLLQEAKGKYFAYLDSDDIYLQGRISKEVTFLEQHPEYALVYCAPVYFFDGEPNKLYRHKFTLYSGDNVFPALLEKMFITNSTILFRREVYDTLGGYDMSLGVVEDWEYFIRMVRNGYAIALIDEDLVRFRLRHDSNTNFLWQVAMKESQVKIFESLRAHMTEEEQKRWNIDYWIVERKKNYLITLLSDGNNAQARDVYDAIKSKITVRDRIMILIMMSLPSSVARFLIEQAWNIRKRRHFERIGNSLSHS